MIQFSIFDTAFMNGKGNYEKCESKIKYYTDQYDGEYKVIYFFDIDSVDLKYDQKVLNQNIIKYCEAKNYDIVWYNKTVEDVLLGNIVTKNKTKVAEDFFMKNKIKNIDIDKLNVNRFELITRKKSNVKYVLDKYLPKK